MTLLCLDLEASGLGPGGFPIEVAVAFVATGEVLSWLIRPEPHWMNTGRWDDEAEALHGLSLNRLLTEGMPAGNVADELATHLWGATILSDNPHHDEGWLRPLFMAAGKGSLPCAVQSYADHLARGHATPGEREAAEAAALVAFPTLHRAAPDAARLAFILRTLEAKSV